MTQTHRIILNVAASHGRSLFVMVCGFLTGRWALMALGSVDYGLLGLIGGLAILFTFLNSVFSTAVSRFYAFSIGEGRKDGSINECIRWFNVAFAIHTGLAIISLAIGYPVGVWLIEHYLTIPFERVQDCIWVLRWVAASAVISIISVPFRAMYTAKQYIAELTIYSVFQTAAYTAVLYYMVCNPGEWLVWISAWLAFQHSFVNVVIAVRSFSIFPECRLHFSMMFDRFRFKSLAAFSGWQMLGTLGVICRDQGMGVVVNKCFGPSLNASYTVAWSLAGRAQTFANEIDGAFAPAITTAYGANDHKLVDSLVTKCSKFSSCLVLAVVVPLVIEMKDVLSIWLKEPPPYAPTLCVLICLAHAVQKLSSGQFLAINATGNIRARQIAWFITLAGTIPVSLGFYWLGCGIVAVGYAFLLMEIFRTASAVLIARRVASVPVGRWVQCVCIPVFLVSVLSISFACGARFFANGIWPRLIVTTGTFVVSFALFCWLFVLDQCEKKFIVDKIIFLFKKRGAVGYETDKCCE